MTEAELRGVREFAASLPVRRTQVADGQLLDRCQEVLHALLAHIDDNHSEDYPHLDDPPKPKRSHHKKKVTG